MNSNAWRNQLSLHQYNEDGVDASPMMTAHSTTKFMGLMCSKENAYCANVAYIAAHPWRVYNYTIRSSILMIWLLRVRHIFFCNRLSRRVCSGVRSSREPLHDFSGRFKAFESLCDTLMLKCHRAGRHTPSGTYDGTNTTTLDCLSCRAGLPVAGCVSRKAWMWHPTLSAK